MPAIKVCKSIIAQSRNKCVAENSRTCVEKEEGLMKSQAAGESEESAVGVRLA